MACFDVFQLEPSYEFKFVLLLEISQVLGEGHLIEELNHELPLWLVHQSSGLIFLVNCSDCFLLPFSRQNIISLTRYFFYVHLSVAVCIVPLPRSNFMSVKKSVLARLNFLRSRILGKKWRMKMKSAIEDAILAPFSLIALVVSYATCSSLFYFCS